MFNDIQYYRDTITIMTCFPTIVIVFKFHYRPALIVTHHHLQITLALTFGQHLLLHGQTSFTKVSCECQGL